MDINNKLDYEYKKGIESRINNKLDYKKGIATHYNFHDHKKGRLYLIKDAIRKIQDIKS